MNIRTIWMTIVSCLVLTVGFCIGAEAATTGISELTLATGENGNAALEQKGYTVFFQGMNLITDEDSLVFLGYKMGSDAITDLVVSNEKRSSIHVGTISYQLVSDINLNEGTGGAPVYLYYTKDSAAGAPVTSLDAVSSIAETEEVMPIKNDGSSPVRKMDGTLANFDEGIGDHQLYLLKISSEAVKPYLSHAVIVSGNSRSEAAGQAVNNGCDYYLDFDLDDSDSIAFIAYQRTADQANALTGITYGEAGLQIEKNADAGKYVLDLSDLKLFEKDFTLSDWITIYMYSSDAVSKKAHAYKALSKSKEPCSNVLISTSIPLYAVYQGQAENVSAPAPEPEEAVTEEVPAAEDVAEENPESADVNQDGDLYDELIESDKVEDVDSNGTEENGELTEEGEMSISSVIGSGSAVRLLILLLLIAAVIASSCFVIRAKKKKDQQE